MRPGWKKVTRFPINDRMLEVCKLAIDASNEQIAVLRRKVDKLTYGS